MAIPPLTLLALVLAAPAAPQSTAAGEQALRSATGRALQGNVADAVALLEQVPPSGFGDEDRAIRTCMIERFDPASKDSADEAAGGVTGAALRLYRSYWKGSLLRPQTRSAEEERLIEGLRALLGLPLGSKPDRVDAELKRRVAAEGRHALTGRTPPLLEFIVWATEASAVRRVPLPEGRHSVKVKMLDDFASLGWSAFATCDRSFTGGWVKPDAIHAVRPGWKDLSAENFRISFLAHETQHFADKARFGELQSWELEYRAKLAELALADATLARILSAFASNQGSDPAVPHSYANRIVLSWMVIELRLAGPDALAKAPPGAIRQAARALLKRDSAARARCGPPLRPPGLGTKRGGVGLCGDGHDRPASKRT